jgi:hypothetical protein
MGASDVSEILNRVQRRADSLGRLLELLSDPPPGQLRDTINRVAVEGRALTNILQNLRGKVGDFDGWYQPKVDEMANDDMLRFFYRLRTASLKQGVDGISGMEVRPQPGGRVGLTPEGFIVEGCRQDGSPYRLHYPPPPGTVQKFIGDSEGGSGFVVELPDRKKVKKYVYVPTDVIDISLLFESPPSHHMSAALTDTSPGNLCRLYIGYLQRLAAEAVAKFGTATA